MVVLGLVHFTPICFFPFEKKNLAFYCLLLLPPHHHVYQEILLKHLISHRSYYIKEGFPHVS